MSVFGTGDLLFCCTTSPMDLGFREPNGTADKLWHGRGLQYGLGGPAPRYGLCGRVASFKRLLVCKPLELINCLASKGRNPMTDCALCEEKNRRIARM
jgi:hypothetical protein